MRPTALYGSAAVPPPRAGPVTKRLDPHSAWAAVTIQVAWELLRAGVSPGGESLGLVREHVLLCLPRPLSGGELDRLAGELVREGVDRLLRRRYGFRDAGRLPVPPDHALRERLIEGLDPLGIMVLRGCCGDGLSEQALASCLDVDPSAVAASRAGLRGLLRSILGEETPLGDAELDLELSALAGLPEPGCRGGPDLLQPGSSEHLDRCPRCARGARLLACGALEPADLLPPAGAFSAARARAEVLALHLHPQAREHRRAIRAALGRGVLPVSSDTLLVDPARCPDYPARLWELAQLGTPARHLVRGARVEGVGRWGPRVLLGPVALEAVEAVRARPWGEVDGIAGLPQALPRGASPVRWLSGAALAVGLAGLAAAWSLVPDRPLPAYPLEVVDTGGDLRFDVDDRAQMLIVGREGSSLRVLLRSSSPSEKGDLATGQGDYRLVDPGRDLLLASSAAPFRDVEPLLRAASAASDPLGSLEERLRRRYPGADLWRRRDR